jgi:hypothetical protein
MDQKRKTVIDVCDILLADEELSKEVRSEILCIKNKADSGDDLNEEMEQISNYNDTLRLALQRFGETYACVEREIMLFVQFLEVLITDRGPFTTVSNFKKANPHATKFLEDAGNRVLIHSFGYNEDDASKCNDFDSLMWYLKQNKKSRLVWDQMRDRLQSSWILGRIEHLCQKQIGDAKVHEVFNRKILEQKLAFNKFVLDSGNLLQDTKESKDEIATLIVCGTTLTISPRTSIDISSTSTIRVCCGSDEEDIVFRKVKQRKRKRSGPRSLVLPWTSPQTAETHHVLPLSLPESVSFPSAPSSS